MIPAQLQDSIFTDNLPLLTQVVAEDIADELPILTEIAPAKHSIFSNNLPLLTQVVQVAEGENEPLHELPALTEAVEKIPHTAVNETDTRQLLQRLEADIESIFTQKLSDQLELLQRQAVEQAVAELKARLPEMLRDALKSDGSSQIIG